LYGGRIRGVREKFNNSETDDPKCVENSALVTKIIMWKNLVLQIAVRLQIQPFP
jgi:hypothetical protein